MVGIDLTGGVLLGAALHYALGLIFVVLVAQVKALAVDTTLKGVVLGILFTEIASLPLLITAAIVLQMMGTEMLKWVGGSFVFHIICGAVFGAVVSNGLQSQARSVASQHSNEAKAQETS